MTATNGNFGNPGDRIVALYVSNGKLCLCNSYVSTECSMLKPQSITTLADYDRESQLESAHKALYFDKQSSIIDWNCGIFHKKFAVKWLSIWNDKSNEGSTFECTH